MRKAKRGALAAVRKGGAHAAVRNPQEAVNSNTSVVPKLPELSGVSKDVEQKFSSWMKHAFGTEDRELQSQFALPSDQRCP
jgi:hypothetical protein